MSTVWHSVGIFMHCKVVMHSYFLMFVLNQFAIGVTWTPRPLECVSAIIASYTQKQTLLVSQ